MENEIKMQVAVIGAGPAGLFAAEALAGKGIRRRHLQQGYQAWRTGRIWHFPR